MMTTFGFGGASAAGEQGCVSAPRTSTVKPKQRVIDDLPSWLLSRLVLFFRFAHDRRRPAGADHLRTPLVPRRLQVVALVRVSRRQVGPLADVVGEVEQHRLLGDGGVLALRRPVG